MFRSGIIPLFFLAWSIYFLHIAEKGKKEAKKLETILMAYYPKEKD
ncbi:hypothetical protein SSU05_0399 [Streptococcus suis 05ZYH33]|nr:hypothetical protein SSU05_0399 [Streptococcus suis 05ZYH33]